MSLKASSYTLEEQARHPLAIWEYNKVKYVASLNNHNSAVEFGHLPAQ